MSPLKNAQKQHLIMFEFEANVYKTQLLQLLAQLAFI